MIESTRVCCEFYCETCSSQCRIEIVMRYRNLNRVQAPVPQLCFLTSLSNVPVSCWSTSSDCMLSEGVKPDDTRHYTCVNRSDMQYHHLIPFNNIWYCLATSTCEKHHVTMGQKLPQYTCLCTAAPNHKMGVNQPEVNTFAALFCIHITGGTISGHICVVQLRNRCWSVTGCHSAIHSGTTYNAE